MAGGIGGQTRTYTPNRGDGMTRPKDIGTAAETAVVNVARTHGFPHAERRALRGGNDVGDVLLCPGVILEVKAGKAAERASDNRVWEWLGETEKERLNARAEFGFLVTKRAGIGPANAASWWVHMRITDLRRLLDGLAEPPTVAAAAIGMNPVRLVLGTVLYQLRTTGYGAPLDREEATA